MKKTAKKSSAKKKPAAKAAAKKSVKKPAAAPKAKAAPAPAAKPSGGAYTPQPIKGIGWAPFRYPLS